ncbi:hypothetical protein D9M72_565220 [compost metagenome]
MPIVMGDDIDAVGEDDGQLRVDVGQKQRRLTLDAHTARSAERPGKRFDEREAADARSQYAMAEGDFRAVVEFGSALSGMDCPNPGSLDDLHIRRLRQRCTQNR